MDKNSGVFFLRVGQAGNSEASVAVVSWGQAMSWAGRRTWHVNHKVLISDVQNPRVRGSGKFIRRIQKQIIKQNKTKYG